MSRILVTGAGGHLGSAIARSILARRGPEGLIVSAREPARLGWFAERGVEVRRGDYDDPASLADAFTGVERLMMVSGHDPDRVLRFRQHEAVARAAADAGVGFLAYNSIARAGDRGTPLAELHGATEELLRGTGIGVSMLRNNMYLENEAYSDVDAVARAAAGEAIVHAGGDGRVGWAVRTDLAEAAAAVLLGDDGGGRVYELSGPPVTFADLGAALGDALGRPVPVRAVEVAEYDAFLTAHGKTYAAAWAEYHDEIRRGEYDVVSSDLADLLGRPPRPLSAALSDLVAARPWEA